MARLAVSIALVLTAFASGLDESTWGPADSVHALDSVITVVNSIVNNPHLSPENLKKAHQVAEDIKKDVEAVETGKLTKQQAHEKVGEAMKELMAFQETLTKGLKTLDKENKLDMLKRQLAEKKAELAKDESMIKLMKLKKELAEKKLMLENLLSKKAASDKSQQADQEEAKKSAEMVKTLMAMAKGLAKDNKTTAKDELPAPLKTALTTVQAREHNVSAALDTMEAEEKKGEADLDTAMKKQASIQGKADANSKGDKMLNMLKREEHRKFAKARSLKKIELKELKDAEAAIEKRDVGALQRTLTKMQSESKSLEAKSGKFLY